MPGRSLPPLPLNKLSAIIGRVCLTNATLSLFLSFFHSFFIILSHGVEKPLLERSRASGAGSIRSSASLRLFVDRVFFFFFYASEITSFGKKEGKKNRGERSGIKS